eukprot:9132774-Lingulodinium_polyedra.AAC.1
MPPAAGVQLRRHWRRERLYCASWSPSQSLPMKQARVLAVRRSATNATCAVNAERGVLAT